MVKESDMPQDSTRRFGISAVAQITGLTTHTIRAWENRYDAIAVDRTQSGRRVYSEGAVSRLQMLNRLVRVGHRIGDIAELPDEELETLLTDSGQRMTGEDRKLAPMRVAVLGAGGASLARALSAHSDICEVVLQKDAPQPVGLDLADHQLDGLILEIPSLTPAVAQELVELQLRYRELGILLIYGFARDRDLEVLRARGIVIQRAPATTTDVIGALAGLRVATRSSDESDPPPPVFSAAALAELSTMPSAIDCQCPQHLATLVTSLVAFEQYSADCENRNEADAALHALLSREVGLARHIVEKNLQRVIDAEGIVLSKAG
jgi:DNA-binding transcriptional MerR regulator